MPVYLLTDSSGSWRNEKKYITLFQPQFVARKETFGKLILVALFLPFLLKVSDFCLRLRTGANEEKHFYLTHVCRIQLFLQKLVHHRSSQEKPTLPFSRQTHSTTNTQNNFAVPTQFTIFHPILDLRVWNPTKPATLDKISKQPTAFCHPQMRTRATTQKVVFCNRTGIILSIASVQKGQ